MSEYDLLTALTNARDIDDRGKGKFPNRPTPLDVERINATVKETGLPEAESYVCLGRPNPKLNHEIIGPLGISQKSRPDERRVWCCECQKFIFNDGCWLWCSDDGTLRMIGHDCAAERFGLERWRLIQASHRREVDVGRAEDRLLEVLPRLDTEVRSLVGLKQELLTLSQNRNRLKKKAPKLFKELRAASSNDGVLGVVRDLKPNDSGDGKNVEFYGPRGYKGDDRYEAITIGRFGGTKFFAKTTPSVELLDALLRKIEWAEKYCTPDAALEFVAELSSDEKLECDERISQWHDEVKRFKGEVEANAEFFRVRNFQVVERWTDHPLCPIRTSVETKGSVMVVTEKFEPMLFEALR